MRKRSGNRRNRNTPGSNRRSYGGNGAFQNAQYRPVRRRRKILVKENVIQPTTEVYRKERRQYIDQQIAILRQALGTTGKATESTRPPVGARGRLHLVGDRYASRDECRQRAVRRQVLLANGKVSRPGGAPGPYKKSGGKC